MDTYKAVLVGFDDADRLTLEHWCESLRMVIVSNPPAFNDSVTKLLQLKEIDCYFLSALLGLKELTYQLAKIRSADKYAAVFIADHAPKTQDTVSYLHMDANAVLDLSESELSTLILQRELYDLQIRKKYRLSKGNGGLTKTSEGYDEQRNKLQELELNSAYKSEFLATVSHEMRTTLTSVIMLSDILRHKNAGNLNQEQIDFIEIIQSSNNGLLELLNQMLDLSKIESGKMSINIQELSIASFIDKIRRLYTPLASQKQLSFQIHTADDIPDTLFTDPIRLEQVLKNLISNALKFTHQGHVTLFLETDTDNKVRFIVMDTGIGIAEEAQSRIFNEYEQAEGAHTSETYGGTGLGLNISRKICRMLGGDLTLKSVHGKGSEFTALLPVDSRTPAVEQSLYTNGNNKPQNGSVHVSIPKQKKAEDYKVLLVDDSPIHNMALKEFLGFRINECVTAETAREAYSILSETKIDCVVLDMYLPDANGREVLKTIRSNERTRNIPVIIYSGKSLSPEEKQLLLEQADAVVAKNVSSYKLLLNKVLELTAAYVDK